MENMKNCRCTGLNEECPFCGGKGYFDDKKLEIFKTVFKKSDLQKENRDLKKYNSGASEKFYVTNKEFEEEIRKGKKLEFLKKIKKKKEKDLKKENENKFFFQKKKTIKKLNEEDLKLIGPNNPNRKALGDTRKLGVNKINIKKKKK